MLGRSCMVERWNKSLVLETISWGLKISSQLSLIESESQDQPKWMWVIRSITFAFARRNHHLKMWLGAKGCRSGVNGRVRTRNYFGACASSLPLASAFPFVTPLKYLKTHRLSYRYRFHLTQICSGDFFRDGNVKVSRWVGEPDILVKLIFPELQQDLLVFALHVQNLKVCVKSHLSIEFKMARHGLNTIVYSFVRLKNVFIIIDKREISTFYFELKFIIIAFLT